MKPCISQATTLSTPFEADIQALGRAGWSAVELWLTKLETYLRDHSVADAKGLLAENQVQAVSASGQGGLLLSRDAERAEHWGLFARRLEWLGELGVSTLVIAADRVRDLAPEDLGRAVDSLGEAAALADRSGVRLALEFQAVGSACTSLDTALALVSQVGAANLGIGLDLYHYYTGPSKFEDLAYLTPANLAWVQVCDLSGVPRELAGDADRILPGEGDFQVGPILDQLGSIGYDGHVSLEVLNPQLWAIPVDRLADAARQSMERLLGRRPAARQLSSWGQS